MTDYHVPSYVTRDAPGTYVPMTMPTCVTMPNGAISMFPDVETAKHAYEEAYPGSHVGLALTRTMEYIDLRGAPWTITLTSEELGGTEAANATSVGYKAAGSIEASSLESAIYKIDEYVKKRGRDSLDTDSFTHYTQSSFKDRNDDTWEVHWITKDGRALGYFALVFGTVVGPAPSKAALQKMVDRYLTRLEGEKAVIAKEAVTSYAVEVDPSRPMEPPTDLGEELGARINKSMARSVIIFSAIAAGLYFFVKSLKV